MLKEYFGTVEDEYKKAVVVLTIFVPYLFIFTCWAQLDEKHKIGEFQYFIHYTMT